MKLGQLKSAIRAGKNPGVWSHDLDAFVTVQKTALIEVLDNTFEGKAAETGLRLDAEGNLVREADSGAPTLSSRPAIAEGSTHVVGVDGSGTLHWSLYGNAAEADDDDLMDDLFADDAASTEEDDGDLLS